MFRIILLFLLLFFNVSVFAQKADILIKNGRIIDGTGNSWYYGDVAIKKDKILAVGFIPNIKAKRIIDAQKKVITPGFIDVHTHIEGDEKISPRAESFIYDGVTSVITGNCGSSKTEIKQYFKYLDSLKISLNVGTFIGHNSVRQAAMGTANRKPTDSELQKMESLVQKAMQDGAVGFSTGLIYIPGTYSETDEVIALAKAAAKYNGVYTSHIRNESDKVFEAIEEALNIGRQAGMPVQISHFKIGKPNWNRSNEARETGLEVNIDQYPYTASSTSINSLIPSWALANSRDSISYRFKNPVIRQKIVAEMIQDMTKRDRPDFSYAVVASYKPNPEYNGKNISEINKLLNRPYTIPAEIETILDLTEKASAQMVFHSMQEPDVENIMQYPFTMVASDSGIREFGAGVPHPRGYGSNARVLSYYVREKKIITLEDAIRRMTSLPAQKFGFQDRGVLKKGMQADILVFDPEQVKDVSTYEKPHAYSQGMEYILVNGKLTVDNGKHTGARNGKILRGPAVKK